MTPPWRQSAHRAARVGVRTEERRIEREDAAAGGGHPVAATVRRRRHGNDRLTEMQVGRGARERPRVEGEDASVGGDESIAATDDLVGPRVVQRHAAAVDSAEQNHLARQRVVRHRRLDTRRRADRRRSLRPRHTVVRPGVAEVIDNMAMVERVNSDPAEQDHLRWFAVSYQIRVAPRGRRGSRSATPASSPVIGPGVLQLRGLTDPFLTVRAAGQDHLPGGGIELHRRTATCGWARRGCRLSPRHTVVRPRIREQGEGARGAAEQDKIPVAASKAIDAPLRAGGRIAGACCVQLAPSYVHVSPAGPPRVDPPNSTTLPRRGSSAIAAPVRPLGLPVGNCWVQVVPSYVHVSLPPPKSTTLPSAASNTIDAPLRAVGLVTGDCTTHETGAGACGTTVAAVAAPAAEPDARGHADRERHAENKEADSHRSIPSQKESLETSRFSTRKR